MLKDSSKIFQGIFGHRKIVPGIQARALRWFHWDRDASEKRLGRFLTEESLSSESCRENALILINRDCWVAGMNWYGTIIFQYLVISRSYECLLGNADTNPIQLLLNKKWTYTDTASTTKKKHLGMYHYFGRIPGSWKNWYTNNKPQIISIISISYDPWQEYMPRQVTGIPGL